MASVIRVKRRIDDDPAEALFLSCKKRRETDFVEIKSVLSFAGTISTKDEPISSHIKEAIRQKKIHKDLHPHSANFKHSLHFPEITNKLRKETEQTSRTNRFRITCSRRALDLDLLDTDNDENVISSSDSSEKAASQQAECAKDVKDKSSEGTKLSSEESTESEPALSSSSCSDHNLDDSCKEVSRKGDVQQSKVKTTAETDSNLCADDDDDSQSGVIKDKMFCIFDVENDAESEVQKDISQQSACGITLNNVPLQSTRVATPSPNEYVYDLYYTHSNLSDFDQEAVLTVEALCDELVYDKEDEMLERDVVYDDEDDSNDENNWRADYPDEDPRFFENADEDYDYAEDMVDTNFLRDDDGDLLAYWMDKRCKVGADSDDGEDEYKDDDGDSSESSDE